MESITLELKPLLRSVSAFIYLANNVDSSKIDIQLLENSVKIHIQEKIYKLEIPNIQLLQTSLSSLILSGHWITFRFLTQPNLLYGKFESEIVNLENKFNHSLSIDTKTEFPSKKVDCKLLCSCCQNEISKTLCFQRILPLPSSGCDPQEWFCHKHDHGHDNNDTDDLESFSLEPKETDLFYYVNYFLFNKHVLIENLKLKNTLVYCNRCYTILGAYTEKNKRSLKIWIACVEFKLCSDNSIVKCLKSPLTDFLLVVQDTAEFVLGETILLEARDSSNIHHVLIKIMAKKLDIFTEDKVCLSNQSVELKSSYVVKVLYKYSENEKAPTNHYQDIKHCEIALPSILAGVDQLISSTARFPPAYRKAEDFYIGYLPI